MDTIYKYAHFLFLSVAFLLSMWSRLYGGPFPNICIGDIILILVPPDHRPLWLIVGSHTTIEPYLLYNWAAHSQL